MTNTQTEKQVYQFEAKESLSMENSFCIIKQEKDILLNVTVGINSPTYGWFEIYDKETEGENWYAEGELHFKNNEVVDFDGVFDLPLCIENKLRELGIVYNPIKL